MVRGFNHSIMYRGTVFHVQTEESGPDAPQITTIIYREGVVIGSMKTGYADIIRTENLEAIVEELMKDQHMGMMRRLKAGEFDGRAFPGGMVSPGHADGGARSNDAPDSMNGANPHTPDGHGNL
jgi:hypothetical protein